MLEESLSPELRQQKSQEINLDTIKPSEGASDITKTVPLDNNSVRASTISPLTLTTEKDQLGTLFDSPQTPKYKPQSKSYFKFIQTEKNNLFNK